MEGLKVASVSGVFKMMVVDVKSKTKCGARESSRDATRLHHHFCFCSDIWMPTTLFAGVYLDIISIYTTSYALYGLSLYQHLTWVSTSSATCESITLSAGGTYALDVHANEES
jgi:hypothetical protein